jgi:alpha-L-rhamnosidase
MTVQDPSATTGQWTARWCWTGKHASRPWNSYACFRRVIDLSAKPALARVRVSADARYTLYVNGKRVHYGPARSYPQFQCFDTLDLAPFLQAGRNSICAVVHQFGVPTFQSMYRDLSGFLLDGSIELPERTISLNTPDGWFCRPAAGWRKDVARLSIQLGFQEHFDANADPPDWMAPDYESAEAAGWQTPFDIGPVGVHPWTSMEPRGVPLLTQHVEPFKAILAQFSGENARGYKVAEDVYHLPLQESRKKEKAFLQDPQAMLGDGSAQTTVPVPPDGQFAMVILDLGQIRTGHIILDIAEAAGDEIIDIVYTEDVEKSGAPLITGNPAIGVCEEATADRYRCRPGPQRWEPFHPKGFRYATLIFRNVFKPMKIRQVAMRQVHADLPELGAFECSDNVLNQIWKVGRETLRNCMLDAYVDCPWREQAQWWGDARIQFRVNACTFGDISLLERGIRQMAQSQAADGSLHAHPPADQPLHRLPDYMLTWVGTLWDYHFHTGQTDLLRQHLPTMKRLFDFFAAHEVRDGLIGNFDGFWVFIDWQDLYKGNFCGPLNIMYLQALRYASAICALVDDAASAEQFDARAASLAGSIIKYFWDPKAKVWRDGFDPERNAQVESTSQQMTALAMLARLKPETHPALARDILLKSASSRRGKILTASPFFYAYILEALIDAGYRAESIDLIREKWGGMINNGATAFWELWECQPSHSRCHGWSASPVYFLSQQVLGVQPVDIGWKQVRIAPVPGKLDFARGVVPCPLGLIRVEWEKAGDDQLAVRVDLPQGMEAEFVGPLGETRTLTPGPQQFHT